MKLFLTILFGLALALGGVAPGAGAEDGDPRPGVLFCDTTADAPYTGTYSRVVVGRGDSCYLDGATVLGNIHARHARNVYVIDTAVGHNIMVRGTTHNTVIGSAGCRVDPHAGNNIMVKKSHNVAICFETVDNNIKVSGNDGRIMLRNNVVGNNLMVTNNKEYVYQQGDGTHARQAAIRVRDNVADNHVFVRRNSGRQVIASANTPTAS